MLTDIYGSATGLCSPPGAVGKVRGYQFVQMAAIRSWTAAKQKISGRRIRK